MSDPMLISQILLWIVVMIMGVIIFALVRQVGILYERVAPAGALMINNRVKAGTDAPQLEVLDLKGARISLGGKSAAGRSTLLFFVSPTCPVCKTLLPSVRSAARNEQSWLDVVFASDGSEYDHAGYVREHGLESFAYVSSELLGRSYGVSRLPYAVLIDEQGKIASLGIVNSREHLESLFESKERGVASIQEYLRSQQNGGSGSERSQGEATGS